MDIWCRITPCFFFLGNFYKKNSVQDCTGDINHNNMKKYDMYVFLLDKCIAINVE
jgi:hypothetical protein